MEKDKKIKKKIYKKWWFWLLIVIVLGYGIYGSNRDKSLKVSQAEDTQQVTETDASKDTNTQKTNALGQLFKLSDIKDKSQDEVNNSIGQPTASKEETWHYYDTKEEAPNCFTNTYEKSNMEIEVFFIDSKAARVTVTPKDSISSDEVNSILGMFYLSYVEPQISNKLKMGWTNQLGTYEFDINLEDKKVSFIYIILDEKYR